MPLIKSDSGDSSSDGIIRYPIDTLRSVAATIAVNVDMALISHEAAWKQAQDYVHSLPEPLQPAFMDALNKHQQRIRDSYQWQQDFAKALVSAADAADDTESSITAAFQALQGKPYQGWDGFESKNGHAR
jgi:hypothetical protein